MYNGLENCVVPYIKLYCMHDSWACLNQNLITGNQDSIR